MNLIESILSLCRSCGLSEDPVKSMSELGVTVPIKKGKWTPRIISPGECGFAMCLTQKHVPENMFSPGETEIIYMDTFSDDGGSPFIRNLWLFLPMISVDGKLVFVKRVTEKELYRKDLIMSGMAENFILTDGVYESYVPEIMCDGCESTVVEIIKRYITNVAAVCKTC